MVPPEPLLPEARELIREGQHLVVYAPRPTGKTTTLAALAQNLTAEGGRVALLVSCERAKVAGDDYAAAELQILAAIAEEARRQNLPGEYQPPSPWPAASPGSRLHSSLSEWAERCPVPIALFFDEIDALWGESLNSVLAQLRDGFRSRPRSFPASVVLCGLRDVRSEGSAEGATGGTAKAAAGGDPSRLGTSSPFNVKVASLRIADFTPAQVAELYAQHTEDTGQEFTLEAVERAYEYTQGQPWLVNALAREVIDEMLVLPPVPITAGHMDEAKERLILARATHLDSLAARLAEPRVRRIMEPLLAGGFPTVDPAYNNDVAYVRDLGLIAKDNPVRAANPIYREVIARVLGESTDTFIAVSPKSFLLADGRLDFGKILSEFAVFWREHAEVLADGQIYHEAAPQLVFMAFLQRVVNGGGFVEREYGIGRGRIDLLVRKPYAGPDGRAALQREAIELKVWRPHQPDPLDAGLEQLDGYLSRLGLGSGILIIFDRRPSTRYEPPDTEITQISSPAGHTVTLMRA
jgi:hypothetical protein